MGLKLVFLVVSRVMSLLGLSRRESWWKDAEILMHWAEGTMTYQDFRIVPVRFGGPLNGDLNGLDYAEHELQEMLDRDEPWDFTPRPP